MTETTTNPNTTDTSTTPGLTEAQQKEIQEKIRKYAKWQVFFAVIAGIFAIAVIIYGSIYSGWKTCSAPWMTYSWDRGCTYYYYPSNGVGLWPSIATTVAAGLALCGTGSNTVQRQRISSHIVFAFIAMALEFISSCIAANIGNTWETDSAYMGMIIVIAVTGFLKIFLLFMSVRLSFQLVPGCCSQMKNIPTGRPLVVMQPGGVYNYPATGVVVQPQGGTMMMTPQGTTMMQPGYQMQPGMMQPGMMQPGMMQPGMMQPGMMQPGMMQPGMMQPGMMHPGYQMQPQMTTSVMVPPPEMKANPGAPPPSYAPVATAPTTYAPSTAPTTYAAPTTYTAPTDPTAYAPSTAPTTYAAPAAPTPDPTSTAPTSDPTSTASTAYPTQPTTYTYTADVLNETKPPAY